MTFNDFESLNDKCLMGIISSTYLITHTTNVTIFVLFGGAVQCNVRMFKPFTHIEDMTLPKSYFE